MHHSMLSKIYLWLGYPLAGKTRLPYERTYRFEVGDIEEGRFRQEVEVVEKLIVLHLIRQRLNVFLGQENHICLIESGDLHFVQDHVA